MESITTPNANKQLNLCYSLGGPDNNKILRSIFVLCTCYFRQISPSPMISIANMIKLPFAKNQIDRFHLG